MITRRGALGGLLGLLAAPAIIRTPGLLMPVKAAPLGPVATIPGASGLYVPAAFGNVVVLVNRGGEILRHYLPPDGGRVCDVRQGDLIALEITSSAWAASGSYSV